MLPVKSILWPNDESKSSLQALNVAVELARQFGAKLYGLQVVPQVPITEAGFSGYPITGIDIPKYELGLKKAAQQSLKETMAQKVPDNVEVETFVEVGKTVDIILNCAKEHRVDLIVMATHGRTGLSHMMVGSVAESVVQRSPIPTLVIPKSDDEE